MVKIRVYELAKDLNITNKVLLNKIEELKIEVKSHMSSLESSAVSAIKKSLLGKNKRNTNVKIKPSVIRRRRKKFEKSEELKEIAEPEIEEALTKKVAKEKSEKPEPAPKKDKIKLKVKKKSESAKIVKPVEPEKIEESEKTAEPDPSVAIKPEKTDSSPVNTKEPKLKKPIIEKDEKKTVVKETETSITEEKVKKKKTTPAKIVKIADSSVFKNLKRSKPGEDRKENGPTDSTKKKSFQKEELVSSFSHASPKKGTPLSEEINTGKHNKGKRKPGYSDAKPAVKRKQRKRKSVVEGEALYKGSHGRKKRGRGRKDARRKKGNLHKTQITTPKAIKRRIKIDEVIELSELAKRMGIKTNEMITKLMTMGVMATVNQTLDFDTAVLIATEFDFEVEKASFEEETFLNIANDDDDDKMVGRAPVATIMGHVDHGKTSLLDMIRQSKITSGEAGGITQHIGAYNVKTSNGKQVTFLDTPGHAAFTEMRSRGAQITDIVILVVAADDGVMPQTIEAINHSKAAGVPVVVAVNKMDKEGADPDRIMRELSELDLLAEEWGGDVIFVKVSAKTGEGVEELLEMISLQSEVLELKANPDRKANGYVIESRLDTGRGAVATVLVKQGTLKDGDAVVCGLHSGRIRAMIDDGGNRVNEAGPSTPVEIVGLHGIPNAGDEFIAVDSDKDAKQIAGHRMHKQRSKELTMKSRTNLKKMFENLGSAEIKELRLIVKADVHGSIEALNNSLNDLAKEEVDIKIVHSGTGTINESDVALATVSNAIIVGFNIRPTPKIRTLAKEENVDIRFYDIIYDVINDIKTALDGMMPSTFHEIIIGRADVRDVFVTPKMGTIAGCHITDGKVIRGKKVRLLRDGVIKCNTQLSSLRRFKDNVKKVDQGFECGIGLEKYNDIKVNDVIECYEIEERKYKAD